MHRKSAVPKHKNTKRTGASPILSKIIEKGPQYEVLSRFFTFLPLDKSCHIHDIVTLPGTSERIMLVSIPFLGADGSVYGICGFEISESLFKFIHDSLPH